MGKKAEKKKSRIAAKEIKAVAKSAEVVATQSDAVEGASEGVSALKEKRPCPHLDRGIDLEKVSAKIKASGSCRCEDCREGSSDRRGKKGKGKHGKKKGGGSADSKSDSKAIWVCLDCGHFSCGGIGLPTTPQSHVVRHTRQTRHPLVIQWDNPHLRWCFPCNMLIPVEKVEENGEKKDVLSEVVKLIKGGTTQSSSADVEDVWFGSGSVISEVKTDGIASGGNSLDAKGGYVARGLTNLGNTCFFNSVMQNLLAMERLRDYFMSIDASFGSLTIALKKLYGETEPDTGVRNVINPRSFFGALTSKAPQFRGYQQHDSHELLRCLLDGLCTEELNARKKVNASMENGFASNQGPTFVDSVFGGQISSTVCCVECQHSSTVYEPFLDLSLPVPTKKPPPKKKVLTNSRSKKTKLPPKKSGKNRPKSNKNLDSKTAHSGSSSSGGSESPCLTESVVPLNETTVSSSGDPSQSCSTSVPTIAFQSGSDFSSEQVLGNAVDASLDDMSWLDYLEPLTTSDEHNTTWQSDDICFQDSGEVGQISDDKLKESNEIPSADQDSNKKMDNPWDDEQKVDNHLDDKLPLLAQAPEVILLPYYEESSNKTEIMSVEAEASSSTVGCGQEEPDFDGFGGLFNEPEPVAGPVAGPSLPNEGPLSSFSVGNISESDPDEVDDTDSPVSVESCLAHFIKPELLTNDNAWECEGCSRSLLHQEIDTSKKQAKLALKTLGNGGNQSGLPRKEEASCPSEVKSPSNGNRPINEDSNGSLVSHDGMINDLNQNNSEVDSGQMRVLDKGKKVMNDVTEEQSHYSGPHESCSQESDPDQADGSCSANVSSSIPNTNELNQESGSDESEEINKKEMRSKTVKVKRDATKRVLIDKAPPILTIHLKRFSQDARGRLSKLNGHVNFGEIMDLKPYLDPRCTDEENYIYQLVGVVEHLGTMRGGHYVAYIRGSKGQGKSAKETGDYVWYHASDAHVHEVSLDQVLRCEAYILFYQKV